MDTGNWPMTRAAQTEALDLDNVRMVPAIDIGDEFRIHPLNKQEVGRRTALWLLQDFFAPEKFKNSIALPMATSATLTDDGKIVIKLKNSNGLKTTDGKEPRCFSVVGEYDRKTRKTPAAWANAEIKGDEIIVSVPRELPSPSKVRYAWHMNPDVNVVNAKNYPLIPFELEVER
jgi:sialate O-acetylesterase